MEGGLPRAEECTPRVGAEAVSEAAFWKYLQKLLPKDGHYTRVESHDTAQGFPDVYYSLNNNRGLIELKDAKRPGAKYPFSRESGLRKSQIRWLDDELVANSDSNLFLALQCGDRVYLLKAALYYDELHNMTEEEIFRVANIKWRKGPKRFYRSQGWDMVGELPLLDLLEGTL